MAVAVAAVVAVAVAVAVVVELMEAARRVYISYDVAHT